MSKDDSVQAQLELLADFREKIVKAPRTPEVDTETVDGGPYPEGTETVHRLKITLRSVKPPVWRRIEVASDTTLGELSAMFEGVMGWYGGHLHAFDVDGTDYSRPDPDWDSDDLDENKYRLGDVLPAVGAKMTWDYDFGDGWRHNVVVEAIAPAESDLTYPLCITGKRACPPEDCGGPLGYAEIVRALRDPNHPDREDRLAMVPPGFDPARFDLHQAQNALRAPRPLEGW
jgi:hypothetical protein